MKLRFTVELELADLDDVTAVHARIMARENLICGAALLIPPKRQTMDPQAYADLISRFAFRKVDVSQGELVR